MYVEGLPAVVRVGVVLPTREAVMSGRFDIAPLLATAERAEALGFDSVWVGESILARPRFEPLTALAAIAARTRTVAVGTAVLLAALRNPLALAHTAATLDRVAEGRLILGVGAGVDYPPARAEFDALGIPIEGRARRMLDGLLTCKALWRGETTTVRGVEDLRLLPGPHRPGGPPIWMGGSGPSTLRRAGRHLDGWMPTSPDADTFRDGWTAVRGAAAEAGRDGEVTPAVYLTVHLGDPEDALDHTRRYVEAYYDLPYEIMSRVQGFYAGPEDGAFGWLRAFVDAGARHLILRFATLDPASQLERAARDLLERLRAPASHSGSESK